MPHARSHDSFKSFKPSMNDRSSPNRSRLRAGQPIRQPEWPTVLLAVLCYLSWAAVLVFYNSIGPLIACAVLAVVLTLHSSLQHEIIHGHPFRNRTANTLLGFAPLGLFIPFQRFRDIHLKHHQDHTLTDPYDDPESNYLSPADWAAVAPPVRLVMRINNTLLGRMLIGPAISLARFYRDDVAGVIEGHQELRRTYLLHGLCLIIVGAIVVSISAMPWWVYVASAYFAMSILKIRTFLEHCAFEPVAHRTVIVEDRGPLALLFLNNNLHAVHHARPGLPWYQLPRCYKQNRALFVRENNGYVYSSYWDVFRRYLLTAKDPVPHPLSQRECPHEVGKIG